MALQRWRLLAWSPVWRTVRLITIVGVCITVLVNFFPGLLITSQDAVDALSKDPTDILAKNVIEVKSILPRAHRSPVHRVRRAANKPQLEGPMRQLHAQAQAGATRLPDDAAPARETVVPKVDLVDNIEPASAGKESPPGEGVRAMVIGERPRQAPCAWVPFMKGDTVVHYTLVMLERFGYTVRYKDEEFADCVLIWTFDYPFWEHCWSQKLFRHSTHFLGSHQKMNHFPGIGYIADKALLARFNCDYCPVSFLIPEDAERFMDIAKANANLTWVIKNKWHRGVKIIKPTEVNMAEGEMFLQAFINNPLLIDGRKFDISVYVLLTSVNPLRLYLYDSDWAARFCSKNYYPFDATDISKYVVHGIDHTPLWKIKSLKKYWDLGYGFKKSLFIYLQKLGYDTDRMEQSIHEVIRGTFIRKEKSFINTIRKVFRAQNHTRNLFELMRFDFLVDDKLRLYLMEANMSPDLSLRAGSPRAQLYKNMLHDLFTMVGIGKVISGRGNYGSHDDYDILSWSGDLRVFSEECFSKKCIDNCQHEVCQMCTQCLSSRTSANLLHAFLEHAQRHGFRRLIPAPLKSPTAAKNWKAEGDPEFQKLSRENKIMFTWFRGKCAQDITWCS